MGNKKKKGKAVKNARGSEAGDPEEELKKAPHTFVIPRGHVGKNVNDLILDMRRVMEPYTASKLKVRKRNVLKDFISVAGLMKVSHLITFTKTEIAVNMRLMRLPRGPTLTFKVHNYSLVKDIVSVLKRHNMDPKQFNHHPLIVLNNFSGEGMHIKLMATMFQNMFPSINVNKVKLRDIKRCVLITYNSDKGTLDFRHYNVKIMPVGMSKGVKKLVRAKIPDMSKCQDISDFLLKDGNLSESEAELDGPHNEVILPQNMAGKGNIKAAKSAIRLTEIGPRLNLELVKIEEGVCEGEVMYHKFIEKTEEELRRQKAERHRKRSLKEQRRKQQEENISNKQQQKEDHKQKSLAGMKKDIEEEDSDVEAPETQDTKNSDEEDDLAYYRAEVGEEPDPDMMISRGKKRKYEGTSKQQIQGKKMKNDPRSDKGTKSFQFSKDKGNKGKFENREKQKSREGKSDRKAKQPAGSRTIQDELNMRKQRKLRKVKIQEKKNMKRKGKSKKRS